MEDLARQKGKVFRHRAQLRGFDVACRLAADGAGLALLPEAAARRAQLGFPINIVHLSDEWANIQLVLCKPRNADLSVHAQSLIRFLTGERSAPVGDDKRNAWYRTMPSLTQVRCRLPFSLSFLIERVLTALIAWFAFKENLASEGAESGWMFLSGAPALRGMDVA